MKRITQDFKFVFNDPNSDTQLKPQNGFKSNLETIYFQFYCLWVKVVLKK